MKTKAKCENCHKVFFRDDYQLKTRKQHFCSRECFDDFRSKQHIIKCSYCNMPFKAVPYRQNRAKRLFCSVRCHSLWLKHKSPLSGKTVTCDFCGAKFYKLPSRVTNHNFCSRKCHQSWNSKQAIERRNKLSLNKQKCLRRLKSLRSSIMYDLWRDAVYKKDHYKCQICSSKKDIVAHHIKGMKDFPTLKFAIDNGVTLCRKCHNQIHYSKLSKG